MSSVLGLKVRPSTAMVAPRTLPPQAAMTLRAMARLRWSLTDDDRLDDAAGRAEVVRRLQQRHGVLGEAGAAVARAGVEELAADAVVEADAARHLLHVGAGLLAQVGDLVDEGDLGGEEGVGRVLDELGRAPAR